MATIDTNLMLQRMLLERARDWFGSTALLTDEAIRRGEAPSMRSALEQTLNSYSEYEQFALWTITQMANDLLMEKRVVREALTRYRSQDARASQRTPGSAGVAPVPQESAMPSGPLSADGIHQGALLGRTSARQARSEEK